MIYYGCGGLIISLILTHINVATLSRTLYTASLEGACVVSQLQLADNAELSTISFILFVITLFSTGLIDDVDSALSTSIDLFQAGILTQSAQSYIYLSLSHTSSSSTVILAVHL
jgi:hypothetical protein